MSRTMSKFVDDFVRDDSFPSTSDIDSNEIGYAQFAEMQCSRSVGGTGISIDHSS